MKKGLLGILGLGALATASLTSCAPSFDNSKFCKPSPEYYIEICKKIGIDPQNCLMIGNDERDDMKAASDAGMSCFLVTDCRIMAKNFVWTGERGSFEQMLHILERI